MEFFTSLHFPPRRTNAKAPPRTLRKSKPESSTRLKTSPKLQCPVQDFRIKDHPCGQLHCRHRGWHSTLLRRARPTACLLPPPQDLGAATPSNPQQTPLHMGCRPTRPGKARGRSVRSVALDVAARAAAENTHICVICPVAVIPPHRETYLLGQSAHRENKNLGISATFLRLRTLPCPGKAK